MSRVIHDIKTYLHANKLAPGSRLNHTRKALFSRTYAKSGLQSDRELQVRGHADLPYLRDSSCGPAAIVALGSPPARPAPGLLNGSRLRTSRSPAIRDFQEPVDLALVVEERRADPDLRSTFP